MRSEHPEPCALGVPRFLLDATCSAHESQCMTEFDARNVAELLSQPIGKTTKMESCLCGVFVESGRTAYSGILNYSARLCKSCEDTYRTASRIVCLKCRRLQGFMPAQQTKDGFLFAEGKCYHIDGCPSCSPETMTAGTVVIEYRIHLRNKGIPEKVDPQLLQHIGEKKLQMDSKVSQLVREARTNFQNES